MPNLWFEIASKVFEPQKDSHLAIFPLLFDFVLPQASQWLSIVDLQANDAQGPTVKFSCPEHIQISVPPFDYSID